MSRNFGVMSSKTHRVASDAKASRCASVRECTLKMSGAERESNPQLARLPWRRTRRGREPLQVFGNDARSWCGDSASVAE